MKIATHITFILLSMGCSTSRYSVIATAPALSVSIHQGTYYSDSPFSVDITVVQEGVDGPFSFSTSQVSGEAEVTLDGSDIPISGEWIRLAGKKARMSITPKSAGSLELSLQVQAPDGTLSQKYTLRCAVEPTTEITAKLEYESRHINMAPGMLIPIQMLVGKTGYTGKYTLTASLEKGKGTFYHDTYVINDIPFEIPASTEIHYKPTVLGEHIFNFKIEAEKFSTTATGYIDVIRKITVACEVEGGFSVQGIGEYNTEGQQVVLKLQNDDLYNFEVAGWFEQATGKRLSTEPTYTHTLTTDCITDISLRLKLRAVQITMKSPVTQEFQYLIQENGKPVVKSVYDRRAHFQTDFKVSDPIKFFYEEYRYDQSTLPPTARKKNAAPTFGPGSTQSGFLYRIDGNFKVYLRKADNPDFNFNPTGRFIESSSTKYTIPTSVTIQN